MIDTSLDLNIQNLLLSQDNRRLREALQVAADLLGWPESFDWLEPEDTVSHTVRIPIWAVQQIHAALQGTKAQRAKTVHEVDAPK